MRLIDKQILRELVGPFLFGIAAFSSVFFAGAYLQKLTTWVLKGMPILTAVQAVLLWIPAIVVYTLPMATLLAVLLGIGRMSGDSEVVALYAGGVSIYRLAVPVIGLGLAATVCSIALNEVVAPGANVRRQELAAAVAELEMQAISDRPFTVDDESTRTQITVKGGLNVEKGILKDVTITRFEDKQPAMLIYAKRAEWSGILDPSSRYKWVMYDGWWRLTGNGETASSTFRESQTKAVQIRQTPEELSLYQKDTEQMSFAELSRMVDYHKRHRDKTQDILRDMDVERWNKLALPLSTLVFAMLALPLGIRPHRGASSVGLGLSIFLIFVYWMIWRYTSALAVQGNLPPLVGAFLADVLGIAVAVVLLKKAAK